jgi:hypothetical protein
MDWPFPRFRIQDNEGRHYNVDHPLPFVDLQALEECLRHQAGIVDHHVDPSEGFHGSVYEMLHLLAVCDVHGDRNRLAATAGHLFRKRLNAILAACAEHQLGALLRQMSSCRFAEPAAGAGNDNRFVFDVLCHGFFNSSVGLALLARLLFAASMRDSVRHGS